MDQYYSDTSEFVLAKLWETGEIRLPGADGACKAPSLLPPSGSAPSGSLSDDTAENLIADSFRTIIEECGLDCIRRPNGARELPDYAIGDDWLVIKSFNDGRSPSFVLMGFSELRERMFWDPRYLYADYLVLSYHLNEATGETRLTGGLLCKIWEIARVDWRDGKKFLALVGDRMLPRANLQKGTKTKPDFADDIDFVMACANTLEPETGEENAGTWIERVSERVLSNRLFYPPQDL